MATAVRPPPGRLRPGHPLQRRPVAQALQWQKSRVRAPAFWSISMGQRGVPPMTRSLGPSPSLAHPGAAGRSACARPSGRKALAELPARSVSSSAHRGRSRSPSLVRHLAALPRPDRVDDARDGKGGTRGWLEESTIEATAWPPPRRQVVCRGSYSTDIATDGTLAAQPGALRQMAPPSSIRWIASGGVGSLTDLLSLLALEPSGRQRRDRRSRAIYDRAASISPRRLHGGGPGRWQDLPLAHAGLKVPKWLKEGFMTQHEERPLPRGQKGSDKRIVGRRYNDESGSHHSSPTCYLVPASRTSHCP